eukprot:TRINITY_DN11001_c0_g1_i2.p1 TRINITY_DN11001_c0_g1~~TRINITY_DN11001_c0_g1_i2.p1  ORF type:complete len:145 (-),score=8.39 TRINITY_DN11001_c0_g1_i2:473-907(-)
MHSTICPPLSPTSCPCQGVASQLVRTAMVRAAKKLGLTLAELKVLDPKQRRMVHDDISVMVIFLDAHRKPDWKAVTNTGPGAVASACSLSGHTASSSRTRSSSRNAGGVASGAYTGVAGGLSIRSFEELDMPLGHSEDSDDDYV